MALLITVWLQVASCFSAKGSLVFLITGKSCILCNEVIPFYNSSVVILTLDGKREFLFIVFKLWLS